MSLKAATKLEEAGVYELEVAVDAAAFEDAVNKAYLKQKKNITVHGFRKGKAPRAFIERVYGPEVFYEDAIEAVYPQVVKEAVEESGLKTVYEPYDPKVEEMGKDGALIKVKVAVKPEVELGEYKGLQAEKAAVEVKDDEVDAEIEKLRERNARYISVEDRPAQEGDMAVIDFEGFVDGVAFDGGKGENFDLTLGSHQFIPGFEEQVAGHKAGESFEINVTFPEEYAEELKGKDATFKIKLHEIKQKELPELDDEFVKDVSEFDTLDELKADTKEKLLQHKQEHADEDFERAVLEQLPALVTAEIPQLMFDRAAQEEFDEFNYRLQSQGIDFDTYLNYTGMERDAMMAMYREQAETNVKTRLALEKIVELEKIEPSADEVEAEYAKLAETYKMDVEKIKNVVPTEDVSFNLAVRKAIEFLKDNAVPKKKKATRKKKAAAEKPAEEPKAEQANAEEPAAE